MKNRTACCLIVLVIATVSCWAESTSIVAPNIFSNAEGNDGSRQPFLIGTSGTTRYQQVFEASEFSAILDGGFIQEISFRQDSFNMPRLGIVTTLPDIQLNFSTTSKAAGSLSPVFSENVGSDDTLSLRGSVFIRANYSPFMQPQTFDVKFILQHPFFYNPKAGNLLLDIRNYEGTSDDGGISGAFAALDATSRPNDPMSTLYATSVSATSGTVSRRGGLITQLTIQAVPEPASWILLSGGVLVLLHVVSLRSSGTKDRL
jgi:hypothetical protein